MVIERKGTAKLNEMLDIERQIQERWKKERVFELDAPLPDSLENKWVSFKTAICIYFEICY